LAPHPKGSEENQFLPLGKGQKIDFQADLYIHKNIKNYDNI